MTVGSYLPSIVIPAERGSVSGSIHAVRLYSLWFHFHGCSWVSNTGEGPNSLPEGAILRETTISLPKDSSTCICAAVLL